MASEIFADVIDPKKLVDQVDKNEMAIYIMSGIFSAAIITLIALVIVLFVQLNKLKKRLQEDLESPDAKILHKGYPDARTQSLKYPEARTVSQKYPDDLESRGFSSYSGMPRANSPGEQYNHGPPPPQQYRPQPPPMRQF